MIALASCQGVWVAGTQARNMDGSFAELRRCRSEFGKAEVAETAGQRTRKGYSKERAPDLHRGHLELTAEP